MVSILKQFPGEATDLFPKSESSLKSISGHQSFLAKERCRNRRVVLFRCTHDYTYRVRSTKSFAAQSLGTTVSSWSKEHDRLARRRYSPGGSTMRATAATRS